MKPTKTFEDWKLFKESQQLYETVYNTGLGGNLNYSNKVDSKIVNDVIKFLSSGSWKKHPAGIYATNNAKDLAAMWNKKGIENLPAWATSGDEQWSIKDNTGFQLIMLSIFCRFV
jgi:hypothetical protein